MPPENAEMKLLINPFLNRLNNMGYIDPLSPFHSYYQIWLTSSLSIQRRRSEHMIFELTIPYHTVNKFIYYV